MVPRAQELPLFLVQMELVFWLTKRLSGKDILKNSRMRQLSTYSDEKGILRCVIIIVASLYYQLLGRSLQEFYLTDWMNTLNSPGFYQKANLDSKMTEEQFHSLWQMVLSKAVYYEGRATSSVINRLP